MKANIFIAGGGSGGHITPALAIAGEILKISPNSKILFLCSRNELDKEMVRRGIEKLISENPYIDLKDRISYTSVFAGKLRRYFSLENILDIFKFVIGIFNSLYLLIKHRPKVVFSKGGYVGLTVGIATRISGTSVVLHESDKVPGLSNRILSKSAKKILTAFPVTKSAKEKWGQAIYTGTPIRQGVLAGKKENGINILGFQNEKPIILVIGGSQGAMFVNELIKSVYKDIEANIVLICGKHKNIFESFDTEDVEKLRVFEFLADDYGDILAASDLVISRSGANSLAEIAAMKKPSILIPLPTSANNHQLKNAKAFAKESAAILMKEDEITPEQFVITINKLITGKTKLKKLSANVEKFFHEDATNTIAKEILETAKIS